MATLRHQLEAREREILAAGTLTLDQLRSGIERTWEEFSARDSATVPSMSQPPGTQSVAEMRAQTGLSAGKASRTISNTSSGKRIRFSRLPP